MTTDRLPAHSNGFTLVEMLVSLAIVMLLAGIVYAGLAPVRAKGRETRCISNLRQLGQALQMYRDDYHGGDPPEARTAVQLGLPHAGSVTLARKLEPYVRSMEIFHCQDEYWPGEEPVPPQFMRYHISYMVPFLVGEKPGPTPPYSYSIAKYGEETPLLVDLFHGPRLRRPRSSKTSLVLILQLNGQVQRRHVRDDRFDWNW